MQLDYHRTKMIIVNNFEIIKIEKTAHKFDEASQHEHVLIPLILDSTKFGWSRN